MLWLVLLNVLLFYITSYPRKALKQGNFYNRSASHHWKRGEISKAMKQVFIMMFKPFLVRDKANNLSLICFCNSLLIMSVMELPVAIQSLVISVNAASIFHYFVVIIPSERKKVASLRKLSPIMQRFASNDATLYRLLGYDSKEVDLTAWHNNEQLRLKSKLEARMQEVVGGDGKDCFELWANPRFRFFASNEKFSDIWNLLVQLDQQFFSHTNSLDLTEFPELSTAIDIFFQQHFYMSGRGFEKPCPELFYCSYLYTKQQVIAEYVNTAAHYTHWHDERFMSYQGVKATPS